MRSEVRSDDDEAHTAPSAIDNAARLQSALQRFKAWCSDQSGMNAGRIVETETTLVTGNPLIHQALQSRAESMCGFFPDPAFKINIHKTSSAKLHVLSDTGTEAGAPMAFFKSRVFEIKMKSSGLTAKGRFPYAPLRLQTTFF